MDRPRRRLDPLTEFLRTEAGSSVFLLAATLLALLWANSWFASTYQTFWHTELTVGWGDLALTLTLQEWVNDVLMVLFFFVVGLEIKRELTIGELRELRKAALPVLAALGGMVVPALVYVFVAGGGEARQGWGIPMATDIAFALGVLALLGTRVPLALKAFLLTLAIADDIGAIVVIAIFYSGGVSLGWLLVAVTLLVGMIGLRAAGVARPLWYVPFGVAVWFCVHESGVHATIAGVVLGLLTPAGEFRGREVLNDLEHRLTPWSSYFAIPIFALANAGVGIGRGVLGAALTSRVTWAVVLGLVVGKTVGVLAATLLGLRLGLGPLPAGMERRHLPGLGALAGIGFTVSLFIAFLAFGGNPTLLDEVKIGILLGSTVSAALGAALLLRPRPMSRHELPPEA